MNLPTKERLARALEALNDARLARMISLARKGYYDDYESEIATPIATLVHDLQAQGYPDMAKRAMNGEWDCTREEAEAWFNREGRRLLGGMSNE